MAPDQGFAIFGSSEGDTLGVSVSDAGDVNDDGVDDIVIGALKATSSYRGGAYVIYGTSRTSIHSDLTLTALNSQQGFAMVGPILVVEWIFCVWSW